MGFDVWAFSKARFIGTEDPDDDESDDKSYYIFAECEELVELLDGKEPGYYVSDSGERFDFNGGPSWFFKQWRRALALTILDVEHKEILENPDEYVEKPFFELLYMTDNSGAIGPETSKCLAKDFQDFHDTFKEKIESVCKEHKIPGERIFEGEDVTYKPLSSEIGIEVYGYWQKAFEVASDDGFVLLH